MGLDGKARVYDSCPCLNARDYKGPKLLMIGVDNNDNGNPCQGWQMEDES